MYRNEYCRQKKQTDAPPGTENEPRGSCGGGRLVIGNNKKKDLIPILEEYLAEKKANSARASQDKTLGGKTIVDINHTDEYESMQITRAGEHTRAYI